MLMKDMSKFEIARLFTFQSRILAYSMWEMKVIEKDLAQVGIDVREVMERGRAKQMVVMRQSFESLGMQAEHSPVLGLVSFAGELLFPSDETRVDLGARWRAAYSALRGDLPEVSDSELSVHDEHEIVTAQSARAPEKARHLAS